VVPPSLEICTGIESALGALPVLFEYQRRYDTMLFGSLAFRTGDTSVVVPPSMSAAPTAPPTAPWPVTQQIAPASAESFSGCAAVPTGSTRTQSPLVALSPAAPTVQPVLVSKVSSKVTLVEVATVEATEPGVCGQRPVPTLVCAVTNHCTVAPHGTVPNAALNATGDWPIGPTNEQPVVATWG
jgi:hypothetical protein